MSSNSSINRSGNLSSNSDFWLSLDLPTLPLPRNTWGGGFTGASLINSKTKKLIAATPNVDPIISEYGAAYLCVRFTARFIEFVKQKYILYQFLENDRQLNYAFEIHRKLNDFIMIEIDPTEQLYGK